MHRSDLHELDVREGRLVFGAEMSNLRQRLVAHADPGRQLVFSKMEHQMAPDETAAWHAWMEHWTEITRKEVSRWRQSRPQMIK